MNQYDKELERLEERNDEIGFFRGCLFALLIMGVFFIVIILALWKLMG